MEIIKPGQIPPEPVFTVECTHCGCIFKVKSRECNGQGTGLRINCPTCHKTCWIGGGPKRGNPWKPNVYPDPYIPYKKYWDSVLEREQW